MSGKVLYSELNPQEFKSRILEAPIAYLPLGTLEWHGKHLPLGTDGLISSGFFIELANNIGGIVLPMLFLGPDLFRNINEKDYYGMDIHSYPSSKPEQLPGSAYWVNNELFKQIIEVTLKQLKRAGFKIIIAHGHGPSTLLFAQFSKEWQNKFGLNLFTCWQRGESPEFGLQTDHAASNETSLMMALRPELVNLNNLSKNMNKKPLGLIGKDPRKHANSELGTKIITRQIENMAIILRDKLEELSKKVD
ncbi:MAG: creatininase family protein [Candidatus Hodarchaeota archaeon]